ncbi:MAG: hypothetical protein KAH99_04690, partial [Verrucomicrobia bacterium]|nr:hypothetical protein [Verrucomicrobiota bacterium]
MPEFMQVLAGQHTHFYGAEVGLNQNLVFPEQPYQDGITHSDEVLDKLGPPLKMTALPHGYAFM